MGKENHENKILEICILSCQHNLPIEYLVNYLYNISENLNIECNIKICEVLKGGN